MDSNPAPNSDPIPDGLTGNGYATSGRIMLSAIVILFFVIILMVSLHLYARWYLIRARRRQQQQRIQQRRAHMVFYSDPSNPQTGAVTVNHGLDSSVLMALPVFSYSSKTHLGMGECAVCLSDFEEHETGRVLPKCKHCFHIDCIDMWFLSHSTCPICRSPVEPANNVLVHVNEPDEPLDSGLLCDTCRHEEEQASGSSTSSFGDRRKKMDVSIEIPTRPGSFRNELRSGSPVSRMLAFTRIISRDRRTSLSPSENRIGSTAEPDIERGTMEETPRAQP